MTETKKIKTIEEQEQDKKNNMDLLSSALYTLEDLRMQYLLDSIDIIDGKVDIDVNKGKFNLSFKFEQKGE